MGSAWWAWSPAHHARWPIWGKCRGNRSFPAVAATSTVLKSCSGSHISTHTRAHSVTRSSSRRGCSGELARSIRESPSTLLERCIRMVSHRQASAMANCFQPLAAVVFYLCLLFSQQRTCELCCNSLGEFQIACMFRFGELARTLAYQWL